MDKYFLDSYPFEHFTPMPSGNKKKDEQGNIIKTKGTPIHHILEEYFIKEGLPGYKYSDFLAEYIVFANTTYVDNNDQNHLGLKIGNHLNFEVKQDKRLIYKAYKLILILYYRFDIPFQIFIPPEKKDFLLGKYHARLASRTYFTDLRDANFGSSDFIVKYKELINYCLKECKEYIKIYEYTGRGSKDVGSLSLVPYFKANYSIYNLYLKHIKNNIDCEYHRVFGLPIYYHFDSQIDRTVKSALYIFVKQCSLYSFKHICDVLFNLDPKIRNNSEFSISFMPPRTYQYALFDRNKIYNEYYKMSDQGISTPTFSFINDTSGDLSDYSDNMNMEFDGLVSHSGNTFTISEPRILKAFVQINSDLKKLIEYKNEFTAHNKHNLKKGILPIKTSIDTDLEWINKNHLNGMIQLHNQKLDVLHRIFKEENNNEEPLLKTMKVTKTTTIKNILSIKPL